MDHFVIAITRTCGSGATSIGRILAKNLGVELYDRNILRLASDDSGISEELFARADEDQKQSLLTERLAEHPEVAVTWFRADSQKEGGRYEVAQGRLRQIDTYARCLVLEDGSRIALDTVLELEILAPEEPEE